LRWWAPLKRGPPGQTAPAGAVRAGKALRWLSLLERLDRIAVVGGDEEDSCAFRERRHDLAGEAKDGGLVCGAVARDEGASVIRQRVEDAAQCSAEPLRVVGDELGVGLA
jgi:hypothetical protein